MGRHSLPPFVQTQEGRELYIRQLTLQTRMDTMMADAAQVHANVQAYISAVKSKVDELHVDGGTAADLQAQLDEINDAVLAAHTELTGAATGEQPQPETPAQPEPAPDADHGTLTDVPASPTDVDQPSADQPAEPASDVPAADQPTQQTQGPLDPNAPSVAPGFSV